MSSEDSVNLDEEQDLPITGMQLEILAEDIRKIRSGHATALVQKKKEEELLSQVLESLEAQLYVLEIEVDKHDISIFKCDQLLRKIERKLQKAKGQASSDDSDYE